MLSWCSRVKWGGPTGGQERCQSRAAQCPHFSLCLACCQDDTHPDKYHLPMMAVTRQWDLSASIILQS